MLEWNQEFTCAISFLGRINLYLKDHLLVVYAELLCDKHNKCCLVFSWRTRRLLAQFFFLARFYDKLFKEKTHEIPTTLEPVKLQNLSVYGKVIL